MCKTKNCLMEAYKTNQREALWCFFHIHIHISYSFLIGSNSAKSLIFTSPSFIIQFVSYIRKKIVAQFYLVNVQPYHITRSISKSTRLFILTGKDVTL